MMVKPDSAFLQGGVTLLIPQPANFVTWQTLIVRLRQTFIRIDDHRNHGMCSVHAFLFLWLPEFRPQHLRQGTDDKEKKGEKQSREGTL